MLSSFCKLAVPIVETRCVQYYYGNASPERLKVKVTTCSEGYLPFIHKCTTITKLNIYIHKHRLVQNIL